AFDRLPALADALEGAGCANADILGHCRRPGEHVQGCWVLDLLRGKEPAIRMSLTCEADWLACNDTYPLTHFLQAKASDRKLRLFSVACCRRIWHLIADERCQKAVEVAESFADGCAMVDELALVRRAADEAQVEAESAEWSEEANSNFCDSAE